MAFFFLLSLLMISSHQVTGFEVFAFLLKTETSVWSKLPWQRITTVCLAGWSAGVYKHISLANSTLLEIFDLCVPKKSLFTQPKPFIGLVDSQLQSITGHKKWICYTP